MQSTIDRPQTLSERLAERRDEPKQQQQRIPEWRRRELERFARIGHRAVVDLTGR
jgi:hypothetical protein